jgi:hypothetical protein
MAERGPQMRVRQVGSVNERPVVYTACAYVPLANGRPPPRFCVACACGRSTCGRDPSAAGGAALLAEARGNGLLPVKDKAVTLPLAAPRPAKEELRPPGVRSRFKECHETGASPVAGWIDQSHQPSPKEAQRPCCTLDWI